jgi:hypothetical protein
MEEMFYISHADIWMWRQVVDHLYIPGWRWVPPSAVWWFPAACRTQPEPSSAQSRPSKKASILMRKSTAFVNQQSTIGTVFMSRHFLHNLPMGPLSLSVTSHYAVKACQRQTLYVIGPICKVRRKWSVVNVSPDPRVKKLYWCNVHGFEIS